MLINKLKERLAKKKGGGYFSPEKRLKLCSFVQRFMPVLRYSISYLKMYLSLNKNIHFISCLLFIIGIGWLLLLPYEHYNKRTYISENALLPGQANLEYGYNDIRAAEEYRLKIFNIQNKDSEERAQFIHDEFRITGFNSAIQRFTVEGREPIKGVNVFAIHRAPRSDGKEALILSAPWTSKTGEYNTNGIAVLLSLAKLFKRNVYWSKDIVLLITDQGLAGTQAWIDAYRGINRNDEFSSVVMPRSGVIQGVINLDFPGTQDYESLGIYFEGVNGQLPNLDLINTIVTVIQRTNPQVIVTLHDDSSNPFRHHLYGRYLQSLYHMLKSMSYLVLGRPSSEAGLYLRYTIDAVTIHGIVGTEYLNNLYGFLRIGRVVESTFRSLNNLLEHFHQSFFFYLLPQPNRYVSISQYMPPVILFACALIFQSLVLYYIGTQPLVLESPEKNKLQPPAYSLKKRHTTSAFSVLIITHFTGLCIFSLIRPSFGVTYLSNLNEKEILLIQLGSSITLSTLSTVGTILWMNKSPEHDGTILKSFSLAHSALVIATVSLLNFTLGVATAILILMPYSLIRPSKSMIWRTSQCLVLVALSPFGLMYIYSRIADFPMTDILSGLLSDYHIVHSWFLIYVCIIYWPINMAMTILVFSPSVS
ncbi:Gaa1-like protein [Pilobolus umbonatus]|nr:Gaa1-like protein [Pilobolus umbonatus]